MSRYPLDGRITFEQPKKLDLETTLKEFQFQEEISQSNS